MSPIGLFERILFCTDFSENADLAFEFALDAVKRRPGSQLYLLHVIPEPDAQFWKTYLYEVDDIDNKAKRDIDKYIEDHYLPRVPEGVNLTREFRIGKDSNEILKFAKEKQIDLIVIGREGHGGPLRGMLFGDVAERVTSKADCAVLVAPLSYCRRRVGSRSKGSRQGKSS